MRSRSNAQKMRKAKKVVKQKTKLTKESLLGKDGRMVAKTKRGSTFRKNGGISTGYENSRAGVELVDAKETLPESFYSIDDVVVVDVGPLQTSEKLPEGGSWYISETKSSSCEVVLKVDANVEKLHSPGTPQLNPTRECASSPGWARTFSSTPQNGKVEGKVEVEDTVDVSRVSIIDVEAETTGDEALSVFSVEDKRMSECGRKTSKRKRGTKKFTKKEKKLSRPTEHEDEDELKNRERSNLMEEDERVSSDRDDEDEEFFETFEEVDISEMVPMSELEYDETNNTGVVDADQDTSTVIPQSAVVEDMQRTDVSDTNESPAVRVEMSQENVQKEEISFRVFKQKGLEQYVVLFKAEASVPFIGKASLKVIRGSVDVSGFSINPSSRWHDVYSASFNRLTRLNVHLPTNHENQEDEVVTKMSQMLDADDGDEMEAFLRDHGRCAAILLKRLDCVAWEFASLLQTYSELMNDVQYESDLGRKYSRYFGKLGLYLCPNSDLYDSRSIRCLPGQEEATEQVMKAFAELRSPPVVVICGKKGTGKSTMCRNLINRFLNQTDSVCYLEADTGQTEFTPSCMISLHHVTEPLLGLPFVHQREAAKMFFFGSNETKNTPDLYLHMVSLVHRHYQQTFQSRPLIVNTNGWMSGLGGALLQDILHIVMPTHIISMQDPTDKHPFDFNNQARWLADSSDPIPNLPSKLLEVQATPGHSSRLGAVQRRSMTIIGYFSPLLERLRLDCKRLSLAAIPPYVVPWRSVAVHVCNADLSPNHILYALNATVVGLCAVDPSEMYEIEGSLPEDGLPKILKKTPVCRCLGIGLIRGIDPVSKNFYVITPLPHDQLQSVNALIKGTHTLPLTALRLGFRREEMPYVCTSHNQVVGYQAPKSRKYLIRNSSDRSSFKR